MPPADGVIEKLWDEFSAVNSPKKPSVPSTGSPRAITSSLVSANSRDSLASESAVATGSSVPAGVAAKGSSVASKSISLSTATSPSETTQTSQVSVGTRSGGKSSAAKSAASSLRFSRVSKKEDRFLLFRFFINFRPSRPLLHRDSIQVQARGNRCAKLRFLVCSMRSCGLCAAVGHRASNTM